jgi:hypothetical protein
VNLRLILNKDKCEIPHSSGSFTLLQQAVKEKFDRLEKTEINDIHFEYFQSNAKKGGCLKWGKLRDFSKKIVFLNKTFHYIYNLFKLPIVAVFQPAPQV